MAMEIYTPEFTLRYTAAMTREGEGYNWGGVNQIYHICYIHICIATKLCQIRRPTPTHLICIGAVCRFYDEREERKRSTERINVAVQ